MLIFYEKEGYFKKIVLSLLIQKVYIYKLIVKL